VIGDNILFLQVFPVFFLVNDHKFLLYFLYVLDLYEVLYDVLHEEDEDVLAGQQVREVYLPQSPLHNPVFIQVV
jgi:inner membrane protein involved in colicin E2 resistance